MCNPRKQVRLEERNISNTNVPLLIYSEQSPVFNSVNCITIKLELLNILNFHKEAVNIFLIMQRKLQRLMCAAERANFDARKLLTSWNSLFHFQAGFEQKQFRHSLA